MKYKQVPNDKDKWLISIHYTYKGTETIFSDTFWMYEESEVIDLHKQIYHCVYLRTNASDYLASLSPMEHFVPYLLATQIKKLEDMSGVNILFLGMYASLYKPNGEIYSMELF